MASGFRPANQQQAKGLLDVLTFARPDFWGFMGQKAQGDGQGILDALMAPGNALAGQYDQYYDPSSGQTTYGRNGNPYAMMGDASNLSGMVTLGAGAVPGGAGELGMGMRVFHGSPRGDLTTIMPSDRGPLGPGVYSTPSDYLAGRYAKRDGAGTVYSLEAPDNLFHGAKSPEWGSDVNPYQIWRDQKAAVLNVAPESKREAISALFDKMGPQDGYPFFARLSQLMGGDKEAQKLLQDAGFGGISGHVDGFEVNTFRPMQVQGKLGA